MLLTHLRSIHAALRAEASIAAELPVVKREILVTLLLMLATEIALVVQAIPLKYFVDELSRTGGPRLPYVAAIAISFAVLYKLGQILYVWMGYHRNSVFWGSWHIWWGHGNRCLLRQSSDWHMRHSTGEKDSIVGKNITRFQELFDQALFTTLPVTMRILFTTGIMGTFGWQYGLVAVATILVYGWVLLRTERGFTPHREEFLKRMKEAEDNGSELTKYWRTIRSLGIEEEFASTNQSLLKRFWQDDLPRFRIYMTFIARQDDVIIMSRALLYFIAGYTAYQAGGGAVSVGSSVLMTSWMERAYSNFGRYEEFQHTLNRGKEALRELVEFMNTPPTVANADDPQWPLRMTGRVVFRHVTFAYPENANVPTIRDFNLAVPAYTSLALVGMSGSGKSTLMQLLGRKYDPQEGSITIDGVDLRDIDFGRYRNEMAAEVLQTIELFNRSIRDNIRIARPAASDEDVEAAARAAGAHEFIMNTTHGYDTMIGEDGLRLSGGQRQRLAIARALIMKPAILILDEATSALDAMSQAEVQEAIDELIARKVCTVFVIAHRLSTIRGADRIVVMDDGVISATGTHAELVETSEIYQQMNALENGSSIM